MTKDEARAWLRTFGDLPDELRQPCHRRHRECSTTHSGECLDDVLQAGVVLVDEPQSTHQEPPVSRETN